MTTVTITEFVDKEIALWGFDYIESLFNRGYEPILTNHGWRWIMPKSFKSLSAVNSTLTNVG